uniref:Uncharacterized protein n=1 Tax=Oryza nivara TaxID=4536 RepID=A0A0E0HMI6_ORYNI
MWGPRGFHDDSAATSDKIGSKLLRDLTATCRLSRGCPILLRTHRTTSTSQTSLATLTQPGRLASTSYHLLPLVPLATDLALTSSSLPPLACLAPNRDTRSR